MEHTFSAAQMWNDHMVWWFASEKLEWWSRTRLPSRISSGDDAPANEPRSFLARRGWHSRDRTTNVLAGSIKRTGNDPLISRVFYSILKLVWVLRSSKFRRPEKSQTWWRVLFRYGDALSQGFKWHLWKNSALFLFNRWEFIKILNDTHPIAVLYEAFIHSRDTSC